MKKLMLLITMFMLGFLVACGSDDTSNETTENGNAIAKESETESASELSDSSFEVRDYVYEIKETEQITGTRDEEVLAVEISFTNNSDEPISPWMSLGIRAEQETDVTVESLTGSNGSFPDDYKSELVEMGNTDIKPGATVDAVIGYEIMYPGTPIKLTNFNFTDEALFEKTIETKK